MQAKFELGYITGAGELIITEYQKILEMDPVRIKAILMRAIEIDRHPEVVNGRCSGNFLGTRKDFVGTVGELVKQLRDAGYMEI